MTDMIEQPAQFRKKPVVITALQWTGENLAEALAFTGKHPKWNEWFEDYKAYEKYVKANGSIFKILTLEGTMEASPGDWIIRGVKGEHYPCKPDIFAATYEPAALPAAQPAQGEADRAEIERLMRERDEARTWLGAANNEFGSAAWNWPDLWRRIAKLKELSNERWQRAEAAEARVAELEADRVNVAETALRMAAKSVGDWHLYTVNGEPFEQHAADAILAITPAAVLAQAEKEGRG